VEHLGYAAYRAYVAQGRCAYGLSELTGVQEKYGEQVRSPAARPDVNHIRLRLLPAERAGQSSRETARRRAEISRTAGTAQVPVCGEEALRSGPHSVRPSSQETSSLGQFLAALQTGACE
jgi:hypothetical protein